MKRNHYFILLISLAFAVTGFFLYQWWQKKNSSNIWAIIPGSTVFALESDNFVKSWNDLQTKTVWKNLSHLPGFSDAESRMNFIDSITGKNGAFSKFLEQKQVVISAHPVSSEDFGFVFYFPYKSSSDQEFLNKLVVHFEKDKTLRIVERNFQGFNLRVIKLKKNNNSFSYFIHNHILIGSFQPLLIEDVVRTINDSEGGFLEKNKDVFALSKTGVESGRIIVDYAYFHKFIGTFTNPEADSFLPPVKNFASSSLLDLNLSHEDILLNGFSLASSPNHFLDCFTGQKSTSLEVKRILPNRTAVFYHYGFDNGIKLRESLTSFWEKNGWSMKPKWDEVKRKYKIDLNTFYEWFGNEAGLSILESMNPKDPDRLVFIHTKNPEVASAFLDKMVINVSTVLKDTVYHESFSDIEIKQINIEEFPSLILGKMFSGFDQCFYTVLNNYVVFSNSIQGIKSLITDVEREDTWGKSIKQNLFLEQALGESNFSLFVNGPRYWNILENNASSKWQPFFKKYSSQFKLFENIAVQFSYVDNKFYTSVVVKQQKKNKKEQAPERFEMVKERGLESPAVIRPYVVKNHYDKSNELFVQDSLNQIYLISKEGQILWKKPIGERITGDVAQIDFFRNNKLQLCFATKSKLHIVDRNGADVSKFPVGFPPGVQGYNLSVIDYDNSKDYRFLVSDNGGNIYMYDKTGTNLEGWRPHNMSFRLASQVKHVRVKNRDYLITVQQNGIVQMLTRRGDVYKGFPLDLGAPVQKGLFIEQGATDALTRFTAVTETGSIVQFNLKGDILKQEQWIKPSKDSKFQLVSDVFFRNWVVARQENDKISILDAEGNPIFEQEAPNNTDLRVQYYNFGGGNEIFAITDSEQEFTYLYDKTGKLINSTPLESSAEIGLTYSESNDKFKAYKAFGREAAVVSFSYQ